MIKCKISPVTKLKIRSSEWDKIVFHKSIDHCVLYKGNFIQN